MLTQFADSRVLRSPLGPTQPSDPSLAAAGESPSRTDGATRCGSTPAEPRGADTDNRAPTTVADVSPLTRWAHAWLLEYRSHVRYLELLSSLAVDEMQLRLAWLEWWRASCKCREADSDLDDAS